MESDRNALLQGARNQVAGQGIIDWKGFLDHGQVAVQMANAENPKTAIHCFPGGADPVNHAIEILDTLLARRRARHMDMPDDEPSELVIASVGGIDWEEYCSQEHMEDDWNWVGIAMTPARYHNPYDLGTEDVGKNNGLAGVRAGTVSFVNNNAKCTFLCGDVLCWKFPDAPFSPKSDGTEFNNGSEINLTARGGASITQFRPEYEVFDPLDSSVQLAADYAYAKNPRSQGGISDMPFLNRFPVLQGSYERPHTSGQEGALATEAGLVGAGLVLVEMLLRKGIIKVRDQTDLGDVPSAREAHAQTASIASNALGVFSTDSNDKKDLYEFLADILLTSISPADLDRENAIERFGEAADNELSMVRAGIPQNGDAVGNYSKLRAHLAEVQMQGHAIFYHRKDRRKVGFVTNNAAPMDTIDSVLGHK